MWYVIQIISGEEDMFGGTVSRDFGIIVSF